MGLSTGLWWWIAAGALLAVEMTTGTFYLLMLALGACGGAVAAHFGWNLSAQLVAAAVLGGGAVGFWHLRRKEAANGMPAQANRDVHLDIGQGVLVEVWHVGGTATVSYRGAQWSARYVGEGVPSAGEFVIQAIDGSKLLLTR